MCCWWWITRHQNNIWKWNESVKTYFSDGFFPPGFCCHGQKHVTAAVILLMSEQMVEFICRFCWCVERMNYQRIFLKDEIKRTVSWWSAVSPSRCLLWINLLITTHHWGNRDTLLFGQSFKENAQARLTTESKLSWKWKYKNTFLDNQLLTQ